MVFAGSPGPSVGWARLAGISRFDSSRNIRFSRFSPPLPGGLAASLPGERRKEILYLPVAILSRTFFENFRSSPSGRPRAASSSKTQPEYNTLPAAAWQGVFRENLRDGGAGRAFSQAGGGKEDPAASPSREDAGARAGREGGSGGRGGRAASRCGGIGPRRAAAAAGGAGQDPEREFPTAPPKTPRRRRSGPRGSRRRR